MYLLDSDFLIHAFRYDFPPDADHDGFWEWLDTISQNHNLVIPKKVVEEIERGTDSLPDKLKEFQYVQIEPTANAMPHLPRVMEAYGPISQQQLEIIDRRADPYLAAHGLELGATVVTNEVPSPNVTNPENKKVPDICAQVGVSCIRYPRFLWNMRTE